MCQTHVDITDLFEDMLDIQTYYTILIIVNCL